MFSETCSMLGGTDMSPAILYRVNSKRLVEGMLLISAEEFVFIMIFRSLVNRDSKMAEHCNKDAFQIPDGMTLDVRISVCQVHCAF